MDPNNSCLTAKEDVVPTDRTLSAAASATPPTYSGTASTVGASCAPSGYHPISAVELFVIMNRAAKPTTPAEKEAAEKAYKLFVRHELSAALAQLPPTEASYLLSGLPRSALEEVIVPPGVLPGVATQDAAAPAEAAPSGVASPDVATQEASALLIAPTDNSSEEAASAPVLAVQGLTDSDHPNPTRHPTAPVLLEIPEANLGTLLSAEMPMDAQQASRKRPATSDSEEQTAATAPEGRQTKKKAAAADAPTAPPTAEEDGFTVPNRRHTAKPKRLEKVLAPPPATSNRFAEATEVVMEAEPAAPARKQTRPPPVIVTWDDEFMDLRRMIKEVVERDEQPKCCNCSEPHVASYRGCNAFKSRKRGKAAKKVQPGVSFASVAGRRAAEQQAPPRGERRLPARNLQPPTNTQPEPSAAGLLPPPPPTRAESGQAAPAAQTPVAKQCQPSTAPAPPAPAAASAISDDLQTLLQTLNRIMTQLPSLVSAAATALQAIAQPPSHG
ncbi:uncharacterized protein LOC126439379 [Schistocerca serialis cubense]|uniref:uncharacterized protein LOC126439379 n=1 Tax=Schistocerca serialis cubense TaxID=2023355 RepID=UPI00214ED94F|nr:uncharacterized protein LOC126439379 [Schistocerca serialis cubense]